MILQPYLKSEQILVCPSRSDSRLGYTRNATYGSTGRALANIQMPAQTPIYFDAFGTPDLGIDAAYSFFVPAGDPVERIAGRRTSGAAWTGDPFGDTYGRPNARHFDGYNFGFSDGHAKWYKSIDVSGSPNKACGITTTPDCNKFAPPQNGLDYNCDGVAGPSTATGWD